MENKTTLATKNQEQLLLQRLAQVPMFQRLTGKHLQVLLKLTRTLAIDSGEALWKEGDSCRALYILLKGQLAVLEDGKEIGQLKPISSIGEISLLSELPHDDEVVGHEKCLLLELPRDVFNAVLKRHSDICQRICRNIVTLLSLRLQKVNDQVSEIAQRRAKLEETVREAEVELNDLNMIRGMRS